MNTPYYIDNTVTLWHADCLDVLAGMGDNTIDAICADPPLIEQDEASCRRTVRRLTKPIQPVLDLDGEAS